MKKLIAFGDSWTHGHGVEDNPDYKEIANPDPFIFNLRMNNSWVRWLADKMQLPFVNFGLCGIDNVDIVNYLKQYSHHISTDDLVIIMWSFPYRHIGRQNKNIMLKNVIHEAELALHGKNYYFVNSFYPTFKDEPDTINHIDSTRWIGINQSVADILTKYELTNDVSVWEYGSRKVYDDTRNFYLGDYHPNLLGYQVIADWLYNELK